ncbi:MAG: glycoside hydrolase family 3 C-terminal domain-containing protein [Clostridia bacterium]|nr:glycoside hydrolase family 3 C-terminal domain-containing protein [Clostridia bacterium]
MDLVKAQQKAKELVAQMTAEEKMSQLLYTSPAIERLNINEYNWWNEASHGVARAGVATVFPHAIGMAATFDKDLVKTVADAISTEARAKYNKSIEFGDRDIYKGLTYWAPNINIFRDPRWGRGQETFGEDPYLTSHLAVSFIRGIQGDGEFYKATACAKHFAVHSGPEKTRHGFDAIASKKDMYETYLPAFYYAVKKADVAGVMGAYNRTNGEPCCASKTLMQDILRKDWQFKGYYVSDCGAVRDIWEFHKFAPTMKEAAAVSLKTGCNLNCGESYKYLTDAYEEDLISDDDITEAAEYLYTIRAMLGEFEEDRPYSDIGYEKLDSEENKALNLKVAEESMVLLKNENNYLPLNKKAFKKVAVVGPNSMSHLALEGNYFGHASEYITLADGVRRVFSDSKIFVADGSHLCSEVKSSWDGFEYLYSEGMAAASESDVTILCLGLDRTIEGEDTNHSNEFSSCGDKNTLYLPSTQMKLAEAICDVAENVIVVLTCGSAIDLGDKVRKHAKAIIHAWYPGALGGLAAAKLITGEASPCGKTPLTFYYGNKEIPSMEDYSMKSRTYRFIEDEPLYPFGFGLSYTEFDYSNFKILSDESDVMKVSVEVKNTGSFDGKEKVQVYAQFTDSRTSTPNYQLCGTASVELRKGECKTVELEVDKFFIKAVLEDGSRVEPDGKITLFVGGHQPDELSKKLCGYDCLKAEI